MICKVDLGNFLRKITIILDYANVGMAKKTRGVTEWEFEALGLWTHFEGSGLTEE